MKRVLPVLLVPLLFSLAFAGEGRAADRLGHAARRITRIWLSHRTSDPSRVVVNWTSDEPGDSVVRFGPTADHGEMVRIEGETTLHHVEIPLRHRDAVYHYAVSTGEQHSADATFQGYPSDVLRVAVVADWHGRPDLSALVKDEPHLLLTAGDNIPGLWPKCGEGTKDCVKPYAELVDAYPQLFRSTPFMPVLGNHDREIRPRGSRPPTEPVYDVQATAFRRFFELPDEEWRWHFDVPDFGVRLVALDLSHVQDFGTTWQTCHAYDERSEQFRWYERLTEMPPGFVVTLYNERNATLRSLAGKRWHDLLQRGTVCVTGFGHFAERAELDGVLYLNTSLQGRGDRYPDPHSRFLASEDGYLLLTFDRVGKSMTVEVKSLDGKVLDRAQCREKG